MPPALQACLAFARRHLEVAAWVGLYALLAAAWELSGGSFRVWADLWQLLPWRPLFEDLSGSLLDLHSQPPLLNLLFGLSLKASVATGLQVESLLRPVYLLAGAIAVGALAAVAGRLVARPWVRWAALLLVVANPYLHAVFHHLFYTAWELLFLSVGALLALRHLERPSPGRLAAALAPAVLLVYTRSAFHPLWFLLATGLLLALQRPRPARWGPQLAVAGVALALVLAWPAKNLARFGFFGFSSWSGLSIARGVPTGEPLLPSGYPARLAAFARTADEPLDPAAAMAAQRLVPPEFRSRPALAELVKADGSSNWNHAAIIPLSRELGAEALRRLWAEPGLLALKAVDFYLNGYALYEGRWPYRGTFSPELTTGHAWAETYEAVVFQPFRTYDPVATRLTTGFALTFPLVLGGALAVLWRGRRRWDAADRTVMLLLLSIGWILALVLFVDGPEGNRVRYSTEPLLFLVAGWLFPGVKPVRPSAAPEEAAGLPLAVDPEDRPGRARGDGGPPLPTSSS